MLNSGVIRAEYLSLCIVIIQLCFIEAGSALLCYGSMETAFKTFLDTGTPTLAQSVQSTVVL